MSFVVNLLNSENMKMKNYLLILSTFISSVVFPQTGLTHSGSFTSGGKTRTYTYYVPAMYYTASVAVPLVFNLHGLSGSSAKQETYEDFRTIADTANFIIVHAEGLNQSPVTLINVPGWGSMSTVSAGAADIAFIMSLLDTMASHYTIDANRVYSAGYSQGGFLSYNLACQQNARFAAVASSCASLSLDNMAASNIVHPTPVMEIHGTTDNTIAYAGNSTYLHVDSLIKHWVCVNNCNATPTIDTLPDINLTDNCYPIHYVYSGGTDGSTVELYKIKDGGHQVPSDVTTANAYGVGNRNMDFKASKVIWEFFRKYSLSTLTSTPASPCLSSTTGVDEGVVDYNISIYPNPSTGIFHIELKSNVNSTLTISNVLGTTFLEKKISGSTETIDMSAAPSGVYFYQVINQNGSISSGKLIIE